MSAVEIEAELREAAKNQGSLKDRPEIDAKKYDAVMAQGLESALAVLHADRDAFLALEAAQLQETMTSSNYVFMLTRLIWSCSYSKKLHRYETACNIGADTPVGAGPLAAFLSILSIPVDIIILPFTFIGSAATGF